MPPEHEVSRGLETHYTTPPSPLPTSLALPPSLKVTRLVPHRRLTCLSKPAGKKWDFDLNLIIGTIFCLSIQPAEGEGRWGGMKIEEREVREEGAWVLDKRVQVDAKKDEG